MKNNKLFISSLLFSLSFYIPLMSMFAIAYSVTSKAKVKGQSLYFIGYTCAFAALIPEQMVSALFCGASMILAIELIHFAIKNKFQPITTVIGVAIVNSAGYLFMIEEIKKFYGMSNINLMFQYAKEQILATVDKTIITSEMLNAIDQSFQQFITYVPAIVIVFAMLEALITLRLVKTFSKGRYKTVSLSQIRANKTLIFVTIILSVVLVYSQDTTITASAKNMLMVLMMYLAICTMSLGIYITKYKIQSKVSRGCAYLVIAIVGILFNYALMFIGVLDTLVNLRRFVKVDNYEQ